MIRPEDIDVVSASEDCLTGVVTQVTFKGVHYEIIVDVNGFKWMIQSTDCQRVGDTIGLRIQPDEIHIMKKSSYSGLFGDYSSFSDEMDESHPRRRRRKKHEIESRFRALSCLDGPVHRRSPCCWSPYFAFTDSSGAFTLENIARVGQYSNVFLRSIWLGAVSTVICLVLGYPVAYLISRSSLKRQSVLLMLIMLPMWMNFLLRTYAWMTLLEDSGLINSFPLPAWPAVLSHDQHAGRRGARHGV